jgi:hypothetical protein
MKQIQEATMTPHKHDDHGPLDETTGSALLGPPVRMYLPDWADRDVLVEHNGRQYLVMRYDERGSIVRPVLDERCPVVAGPTRKATGQTVVTLACGASFAIRKS